MNFLNKLKFLEFFKIKQPFMKNNFISQKTKDYKRIKIKFEGNDEIVEKKENNNLDKFYSTKWTKDYTYPQDSNLLKFKLKGRR